MTQFSHEDDKGVKKIVSNSDVILESDRDQDGSGDLVFRSGGVERARISAAGVGTGWSNVLGGSIPPMEAIRLRDYYEAVYSDVTYDRGVVAIRFDDGSAVNYSTIYPLLVARNLTAGFAVVGDHVRAADLGDSSYMTSAQLRTLQQAGMEIMHHSKSHLDPTTNGGLTNFIAETETDATSLRSSIPAFLDSFVQPGTWTGDYYFDTAAKLDDTYYEWLLRKNYAGFEAYITDDSSGNESSMPPQRRFGKTHQTIDAFTLSQLESCVDQVIQYGGGYSEVTCHPDSIGASGKVSLADFTTFLDYIQTKRDAGLIQVLNPTSALFAKAAPEINQIGDGEFLSSRTGNFLYWQPTSSPTVVPGGGYAGNAVQVNTTNYVKQFFRPWNFRAVYFECYAKAVSGTATARVILRTLGSQTSQPTNIDKQVSVNSTSWTKIAFTFGSDPRADISLLVWLFALNGGDPDVLYSSVRMVKI